MCTGIRLIAQDGSVVHARTLEFEIDLNSDIALVPRGFARTGTTPDGSPGRAWTTTYASVGASGLGLPFLVDGLNEAGLAAGTFYFPGSVGYPPYDAGRAADSIAPWELGSYLLENHASVEEVRAAVGSLHLPAVVYPAWGFAPPFHYVVHDSSGASLVIEPVDGELRVHDNPLGVLTNAPTFDWHLTNLRNYVGFSLTGAPPTRLGDVTIESLGIGSGMLGLPGDFTPPSRFVRAVAFATSVLPSATGREAVLEAFKVLNTFDIPKGSAREAGTDAHGNLVCDYTIWTSANDLAAKRFYFRTYDNSQIRMVDLTRQPLDGDDVLTWSMAGDEVIADLGATSPVPARN